MFDIFDIFKKIFPNTDKCCIDCKWSFLPPLLKELKLNINLRNLQCNHPNNYVIGDKDLVTGIINKSIHYNYCHIHRSEMLIDILLDKHSCGRIARWWEPKDEQDT